jgi:antitoxin VapB
MALNIKSSEADRLARELAKRRQKGITDVVIEALRNELERERRRVRTAGIAAQLGVIGKRYAALETRDARSDDEVLGYDAMIERA